MRKILLFLILISFIGFAYPNITSYLYEYKDGKLELIKVSDKPLIAKEKNQAVLNLDKGKKPSKEQLETLERNIKMKLGLEVPPLPQVEDNTITETQIQKIIDKYLSSEKGEKKIKDIIQNITQ